MGVLDIQADGFIGIAFEATAGTYVAPAKYFPITSESLKYKQDSVWRRPIRGVADRIGAVNGPSSIEGDISSECFHDVLPYYLYAMRGTIVKSGAGPYVYTHTPGHGASPTATRTLSITVVRAGEAFGYVGCVVGALKVNTDNGVLMMTASIVGRNETTQSVPGSPTFSATSVPFGHGMYTVAIPTGATVTDVDTFELNVNDNAAPEVRLSNSRAPQFVRFGEREVTLTLSRDFVTRTEYDAYKALTAQGIRVLATNGANIIQFTVPATIKDSYEVSGLQGQGDLVRADITYNGVYDTATSKSYEFIVTSATENVT